MALECLAPVAQSPQTGLTNKMCSDGILANREAEKWADDGSAVGVFAGADADLVGLRVLCGGMRWMPSMPSAAQTAQLLYKRALGRPKALSYITKQLLHQITLLFTSI